MLVNTAQKTAQAEVDPNPLNDQSSVSLNAVTTADLEVTKAVSNAAPSVGEAVTFTVKATNLGPSPATGVVVNDPLPAGLEFVSATPSQGSYDPGTGAWTVGDLAATQSAVLSLTALVVQEGAFTNTATKAAANEPDPEPRERQRQRLGHREPAGRPLGDEDGRLRHGDRGHARHLHHHRHERRPHGRDRRRGRRHLPGDVHRCHLDLRRQRGSELRCAERHRQHRHDREPAGRRRR